MDLAIAIAKIEAHLGATSRMTGAATRFWRRFISAWGVLVMPSMRRTRRLRLLGATAERHALYGEALGQCRQGHGDGGSKTSVREARGGGSLGRQATFLSRACGRAGRRRCACDGKFGASSSPKRRQDAPWASLRERIAALGAACIKRVRQHGQAAQIEAHARSWGRMNVIHGMVERLAARLAQNGQDIEGWLRLVRSYTVLHEIR